MSGSATSSAPTEKLSEPPRLLRRLTIELFGVIAFKIALLTLIWWVAFAPQPKPDASPDAVAHRMAPTVQTPPAGHP